MKDLKLLKCILVTSSLADIYYCLLIPLSVKFEHLEATKIEERILDGMQSLIWQSRGSISFL